MVSSGKNPALRARRLLVRLVILAVGAALVVLAPSAARAGSLDGLVDHYELEETINFDGTHREYLFETYDFTHGPDHAHEVGSLIFDEILAPNAFNNNADFNRSDADALSTYTYSHSLLAAEGNPNNDLVVLPVGALREFELEVTVRNLSSADTLLLTLNSLPFEWNEDDGPREFSLEFEYGDAELLTLSAFFDNAGTSPGGIFDRGTLEVVLTSQSGNPFVLLESEFELEYVHGDGSVGGGPQADTVPEPGTLLLLSAGLLATARAVRKRK